MKDETTTGAGATGDPASVTSVWLGRIERTDRGFQIIRFQDRNEQKCSLQMSSLADFEKPGTSAVWLGIGNARMHLDLARVRALHSVLGKWIEEGVFE